MLSLVGHTAAVRCLAYSPDGRRLASGGEDGTVRLWDVTRGEAVRVWKDLSDSVETVAFTPDGAFLLAGRADGELDALSPTAERALWRQTAHGTGVRVVLTHPDGKRAFTAGWDRQVTRWNLVTSDQTPLLPDLAEAPAAAALSADGKLLAVSLVHSYKIHLLNADTGRSDRSLMSDDGAVFALAFAPDGSLLAAGDTRGRVLLWDPANADRPAAIEAHAGHVYGLAFTPDGRRLVTASTDRTAGVWDVTSGGLIHRYEWHENWMTCLTISPDGLTVATGAEDRTVAVWDLPD